MIESKKSSLCSFFLTKLMGRKVPSHVSYVLLQLWGTHKHLLRVQSASSGAPGAGLLKGSNAVSSR